MAKTAKPRGYEYMALTDHTRNTGHDPRPDAPNASRRSAR